MDCVTLSNKSVVDSHEDYKVGLDGGENDVMSR
mgnify:CR=1 FL=1